MYVRNKAQPEGSIAEGYIAEECLTFCSRYFEGIETRFNRIRRVNDEPNTSEGAYVPTIYPQIGRPVGSASTFTLSPLERLQAHRYLLFNCKEVHPFIQ